MIMGTAVSVEIMALTEGPALDAAMDGVFEWFHDVDRRFSTYLPDSESSRLGRGELKPDDLSNDMRHVLGACDTLRDRSNGYFDAYAGGVFDPSGYVKGWSVQVASSRLAEAGFADHCVNAGGDIRVSGARKDGRPWRVGILHPVQRKRLSWVVEGNDLAIATSGSYERGRHIVDPFTGLSPEELMSVTVTGADLGVADAYATAAVAMGPRGLRWLASLDEYEAAVVTVEGEAFQSRGFPTATPLVAVSS